MKYIQKRILSILAVIILLVSNEFCYSQYTAVYREVITKNIANGVTYQDVKMITDRGWIHYYVLKANLDNPNLRLKYLKSNEGLSKRSDLETIANQDKSIVGAINSDFFWSNSPIGETIGAIVEDNKVISTPNNTQPYATFYLTEAMKPYIDYLKNNVTIIAPNGKSQKLFGINKRYRSYDITMFTKEWGNKSPGAGVEMIVKGDTVKGINFNGDTGKYGNPKLGVGIPDQNTTVFASAYYKNKANFLMDNFRVGAKVKVKYDFGKGIAGDKLKLAMGGKYCILKDGKITDKAWNGVEASVLNPSTGLGFDKENNIYMIVVDGRQEGSDGMNYAEMATALRQLGATDAISFDGGTSTTMVARMPGDDETSLVNVPSGGSMSKIVEGIGFSITAPKGPLYGIELKPDDSKVFKNTRRFIDIIGYDINGNKVNVDANKIKWQISGVQGKIDNKYFIPSGTGKAVVKASIGNISASTELFCLDTPLELKLDTLNINPFKEKKHTFTVLGIDKEGYKALIDKRDLVWSIENNMYGNVSNGVYTLDKNATPENTSKGFTYIKASMGNVNAYCGIGNVNVTRVIEDFSNSKAVFAKYPEKEVVGSLEFSSDIAKTNKSARLKYDFSKTDKTRAAYIDFNNKNIGDAYKIGFWAYGNGSRHMLRGIIKDESGKNITIDFAKEIDWKGWKWVEADLTTLKTQGTLRLSRVYIVEPVPENKDVGEIYIDDITISESKIPDKDDMPPASAFYDYQMGYVPVLNKATDFSLAFVNSWKGAELKVNKLNDNASVLITDGLADKKASVRIMSPVTINFGIDKQNNSVRYKNAWFYNVKTDKYGITHFDARQWNGILQVLNSSEKLNTFIILNSSIWGSYFNNQDRQFLLDKLGDCRLKTGRNVYLVELNAPKTVTYVDNGVRFINVNTDNFDNIPIVQVTNTGVKYRIIK